MATTRISNSVFWNHPIHLTSGECRLILNKVSVVSITPFLLLMCPVLCKVDNVSQCPYLSKGALRYGLLDHCIRWLHPYSNRYPLDQSPYCGVFCKRCVSKFLRVSFYILPGFSLRLLWALALWRLTLLRLVFPSILGHRYSHLHVMSPTSTAIV